MTLGKSLFYIKKARYQWACGGLPTAGIAPNAQTGTGHARFTSLGPMHIGLLPLPSLGKLWSSHAMADDLPLIILHGDMVATARSYHELLSKCSLPHPSQATRRRSGPVGRARQYFKVERLLGVQPIHILFSLSTLGFGPMPLLSHLSNYYYTPTTAFVNYFFVPKTLHHTQRGLIYKIRPCWAIYLG